MNWISSVGAIAELILEILAALRKREVHALGEELKNAKTPEDKQAVAARIAAHLYN